MDYYRASNKKNIQTSFVQDLRTFVAALEPNELDRKWLYALLGITILAILNRAAFLQTPVRYDEAYTFLTYTSHPLQYVLTYYNAPNNHVFHTLLVYFMYTIIGDQLWILRLPAFISGVLLVPVSYLVAYIFYNKYAALLSAGFVASSSILIEYSTNARGYTLVCLIFLLILGLGVYLKDNKNRIAWMLFIILSALGFYTIPIMLYPFGVIITWLFLSNIGHNVAPTYSLSFIKNLIAAGIMVIILTIELYMPIFIISGVETVVSNRFVRPLSWAEFTSELPSSLLLTWELWNRDIPIIINVLIVAGFLISFLLHNKLAQHRIPIILAIAIWCIPMLMIQRVVPFARVWLFFLPIYIILASVGLSWCFRQIEFRFAGYGSFLYITAVIILSLMLSFNVVRKQSVYYSTETGSLRDAEKITIFLKNYLKPKDNVLVAIPSDYPLFYYFRQYNLSSEYIKGESDEINLDQRILVVVNNSHDQTLENILDKTGVSALSSNLVSAKIIRQYESATLYEVNK